MIDSTTTALSYTPPSSAQPHKQLSPAKEAEKARLEARLSVLEKKIENEKKTGLDPAEADQKKQLEARDAEVKAHERAHLAAAGGLASGGMSLTYQTGPDGRSYAVGGSVQIDTSKANTPEETIQKAQRIRAAALAPSDPSSQDLQVAARASQMEAEARTELAAKKQNAPEATDSRQAAIYGAFTDSESPDSESSV